MTPTVFSLPTSAYVPLGLAFFGLGTGYLIYGPQELFGFPERSPAVDWANGWYGVWMPGFLQFLCGTYILVGLTWFHVFHGAPLYAAGILTSVFGVHWFAIGLSRMRQGDMRVNGFMAVAFFLVSVLGLIVFAEAGDIPVAILFVGLCCVYFSGIFSYFGVAAPFSVRAQGFFHTVTGLWLMYLTYGIVLNLALGWHVDI